MQVDHDTLPPYFLPLFPVFFVAVWTFVCLMIGSVSGWMALAKRFTRQSEPYGDTRTAGPWFYSVYMRFWTHYSSLVHITAADDALYLSVLFLFRIGHPPLRIPWSEIRCSRTKYFWRRYVVLTLGLQEQVPMRISERMARNLGILERFPQASYPIE